MKLIGLSRFLAAAVTISASLSQAYIVPGGPGPGRGDNPGGVIVGGVLPNGPGVRPPEPGRPGPVYPGPIRPEPRPPGPIYPGPRPPIYPNPGPGYPYPGPVRPGPVYPGPVYPGPIRPGPVYPGPVYPGPIYPNPGYPGGYDVSRTGYVQRWVMNESLQISNYVDLNYLGDGDVEIDSVEVNLGGSQVSSRLDLVINGEIQDSSYSPNGYVVLYPRDNVLYGLDLNVNGQVYINSITVHMHQRY